MAYKLSRTWAEFRTVYAINFYDFSSGEGNLIFNTGAGGIYPSPPCSVLFRTTQFARIAFQVQPWFYINEVYGNFFLNAAYIYGGLIPDKEWEYFKGKSVTNAGESFAISDDAQFAVNGQSGVGGPPITAIQGFTSF